MKVLVVDDVKQNRLILEKLLTKNSHEVLVAENGQEAIDLFISEKPDLILMDVMMPVMDGLEATKAIRSLSGDKWTPIIILSAMGSEQDIVKGLKAGADDYMPKPITHTILYAKITSMQRSVDMQSRIMADAEKLRAYRDQNEQEHDFAEAVFNRIINQNDLRDSALNYWLLPAERFSGDLIAAKRIDANRLYFMLADSTGHGLSAALPTIIVNQVFQAMTSRSFLVSNIAKEINRRLKAELPPCRFVALALGMIDSGNKTIEFWNGGLPEQWVLNVQGQPMHTFQSRHIAAGILDEGDFDDRTEVWRWQEDCELFMYSDGVTDVYGHDKALFGTSRLTRVLQATAPGERIKAVQKELLAYMDKKQVHDDISCLSIGCK